MRNHMLRAASNAASNIITVTYIAGTNINTAGTTFTFTSASIGTANANRRVVVAIYTNGSSVSNISSVTIGGVSADQDIKITTITTGPLAIYSRAVATGTTATIVVNTTGTAARCRIQVYSIVGTTSIPVINNTDSNRIASTTSISASLNVSNGNCVIGNCGIEGTDADIFWSGLIEDNNGATGSSVRGMSVASGLVNSRLLLTSTATIGTSAQMGMVLASYR